MRSRSVRVAKPEVRVTTRVIGCLRYPERTQGINMRTDQRRAWLSMLCYPVLPDSQRALPAQCPGIRATRRHHRWTLCNALNGVSWRLVSVFCPVRQRETEGKCVSTLTSDASEQPSLQRPATVVCCLLQETIYEQLGDHTAPLRLLAGQPAPASVTWCSGSSALPYKHHGRPSNRHGREAISTVEQARQPGRCSERAEHD